MERANLRRMSQHLHMRQGVYLSVCVHAQVHTACTSEHTYTTNNYKNFCRIFFLTLTFTRLTIKFTLNQKEELATSLNVSFDGPLYLLELGTEK